MKSKEELEKEPMPYDNTTPKKCPSCGNWFLSYPALSRRDNETYICPDCGVKEAMEDYMNSVKKEGLQEATANALLEDPMNESFKKPLTEKVDWDYYDKFEDLINKYMPDQGEGETFASQIVTAINKLVYKWYNDGDVFDNVNSGLQGWANDLSSYANWLYKYAPGDAPAILKNIYGMGEEADYETLLQELADCLLDENLLSALESKTQGSIYNCDGPFEFKEYDEDEEEDYYEEDEEELDESKEVIKKELNKDALLNKLEDYVLNQYTIFNDKLYDDFGDIQMNDKDNNKRSIYVYYDVEEDKISVTVGAAGARTFVDTLDEVAQFINAEIAKVNAQDEEIKKLTTEAIDNYEDMERFDIDILNNGRSHEKFDNYEDFCKALKRYFTEKETSIYNKLRTFDRSKINDDGYIQNDYQNMSTIAYPKENLEESVGENLDKEHNEYLKKMDKKYKTFCKNMELNEKDPDDALFALDELEGQFGDEDGEYQELREFIYNELLESKELKTENTKYWVETIGFNPYDVNYEKNPAALEIIEKFKKAGKLDSLFDYFAAGLVDPFNTEEDYLDYVADTDISDYEIYNGKLEEGKGKFTDEEIIKAIKSVISDNNGIFTDDSKYDVIEKLTGIKDIEMMPQGLYERVNEIYENNFNK